MAKPEIQSMIFASSQSTQRDNVRASTIFIHLLKSGTGKAVISLMTSNKLLIKIILVLLIVVTVAKIPYEDNVHLNAM